MIKAVIFDCFGVLYTDGKSVIIDKCPSESKQDLSDLFMQADYGYISGDGFSTQAAALLGIDVSELLAMSESVYMRNEPLIERIKQYRKQYKIGLLSNVSEEFFSDLFSVADRSALFDTVVLSSQVGLIKPSADIYLLAADRLGVEPGEAVMIDDVERNVEGARNTGMYGIRHVSTNQTVTELEALLASEAKDA